MSYSKKQKSKKEYGNIGLEATPPKQKCVDEKCPWHGSLPVRGRIFVGTVKSAAATKSAVVAWEYTQYLTKYERFERRHSSVSAYNPSCVAAKKGDLVRIAECRPVSKTKSFVVIEILTKIK